MYYVYNYTYIYHKGDGEVHTELSLESDKLRTVIFPLLGVINELRSVKICQLIKALRRLGITVLKHPQQVIEQHHFASDGDRVLGVAGRPFHEFLEKGVVDDVGADEVAAPRLAHVDRVEVVLVVVGGIVSVVISRLVVGRRGVAGVGAGEFEWLHFLEHRLELCELPISFGHGGASGISSWRWKSLSC